MLVSLYYLVLLLTLFFFFHADVLKFVFQSESSTRLEISDLLTKSFCFIFESSMPSVSLL